MTQIKPFQALRPAKDAAAAIAALPYDVYSSEEARVIIEKEPLSFLKIDRPETMFPKGTDMYSPAVYQKAKEQLDSMCRDRLFITEDTASYYIYELTLGSHTQTGLVGCASIDDYLSGTVRKHENTRPEKEQDRIRHIDICNAQTGPIFLAYPRDPDIHSIIEKNKSTSPLYCFTSEDGVTHTVWKIGNNTDIRSIEAAFQTIPNAYIADGHHRAASAVKVGLKRREASANCSKEAPSQYFLSILFPDDELQILDYNRVIVDLNGHTLDNFMSLLEVTFHITKAGVTAVRPSQKGEFGMYVSGTWYHLLLKKLPEASDIVAHLDVSILQDTVLNPILGIQDPKTDARIKFVGGSRGLLELEKDVNSQGQGVAFSLYPTSLSELFDVADAGKLMPPKSTWFEPKPRSGLFIHSL